MSAYDDYENSYFEKIPGFEERPYRGTRSPAERSLAEKIASKLEDRKIAEILEALPEDTYATGQVIVFTRKFKADGPTYTYAAVKGGPSWYCTGKLDGPQTWAEVLAFMYGKGLEFVQMHEVTLSTDDDA